MKMSRLYVNIIHYTLKLVEVQKLSFMELQARIYMDRYIFLCRICLPNQALI